MKKILSLFLSLILVSSLIFGSLSSAVFAADEISLSKEILDKMGNNLAISGILARFGYGNTTDGGTNILVDETVFNEKALLTYARADNNTESRLQIGTPSGISSGKVTFSYKLYLAAKSDGTLCFRARRSGATGTVIDVNLNSLNLNPYEWYDMVIEIDLDSVSDNCKVKAIDESGSEYASAAATFDFKTNSYSLGLLFLWGAPKGSGKPAGTGFDSGIPFYAVKDIYISHEDGTKKAEILSIGSDGEVMHSQRDVNFKLPQKISTLQSAHIQVKNKINPADTINVSTLTAVDANGSYTATLERNLTPWTEYYLEISGSAYSGYKEVMSDGTLSEVTSFMKEFHTPSAPFDIKNPDFTYDGTNLLAETTLINTTGAKDVCFVLASYSADGKIKSITKAEYPSFEAAYPGSYACISAPAQSGDIIRFFVIDNMLSKKSLFTKSWTVKHDGTPAEISASSSASKNETAGTVKAGDFDYSSKKISIDVRYASSDAANGVLTVYSDASNPVFIDLITTGADGTYVSDISFPDNFAYGTYTAEFITDSSASYTDTFTYYTPDEIKEFIRNKILSDAKQASNPGALMQVILGLDENENKIYDEKYGINNFDVFGSDAKNIAYDPQANTRGAFYDLVRDKAEVFVLMNGKISQNAAYSDLAALFNSSAMSRYNTENTSVSNPSTNNNSYGSTNTQVTVNKGPSSSSGTSAGGSPSVPGVSKPLFNDVAGHWAQRYTEELSKNGIIDGYADGTFRPDGFITRAELAKLLSEAFGNGKGGAIEFTDVLVGSWYYEYIVNAFAQGIITGYEDGSFRPDSFVTKQDAILMVYRALLLNAELPSGYKIFKDDTGISPYATDATGCLGELGIITGNENGEFKPLMSITRAEIAAVLCRSLDYLKSH